MHAVPSIYSSARIPRVSKLLISGLFQKVRVLAQDGIRAFGSVRIFGHDARESFEQLLGSNSIVERRQLAAVHIR